MERSKSWKQLKIKIRTAIPWKQIRIWEGCKRKDKFWDAECHRKKETLKREQTKFRVQKIDEKEWKKKECRNTGIQEYRKFIEAKKRDKAKVWIEEIEKDKSMRLFWERVEDKKKRDQIDKDITQREWKEHFRKEYVIKREVKEMSEQERDEETLEQNQEESEITREVREVLRNLKREMRRQYGIPNEAWII